MRASLWRAGGSTRPAALRLRQERSLGTGRPHLERPSKEAVQEFVDRIRLVGSGQVGRKGGAWLEGESDHGFPFWDAGYHSKLCRC